MWILPKRSNYGRILHQRGHEEKEDWIELAKDILIHIQLRDNLEKTLIVEDHDNKSERRILIKPNSLPVEEGRFLKSCSRRLTYCWPCCNILWYKYKILAVALQISCACRRLNSNLATIRHAYNLGNKTSQTTTSPCLKATVDDDNVSHKWVMTRFDGDLQFVFPC